MIFGEFEWDEAKALSNARKHGLTFETASAAFDDAFSIEISDDARAHGEQRYRLVGRAGGTFVTIVYVERGDRTRIISARQATRRERERYLRENTQE